MQKDVHGGEIQQFFVTSLFLCVFFNLCKPACARQATMLVLMFTV